VGQVSVVITEGGAGSGGSAARRLLSLGAANATELLSLRYAIESIVLATNLSSTGSAYDLTGAETWTIYRGTDTAGDYDSFDSERAAEVGPDHPDYVDLMNATQRAALAQRSEPLTSTEANRDYHFVVINWKRPIFIKAQVRWNETHTLYSKAWFNKTGDCGVDTAGDCATQTNSSLWESPAEMVPVELNNGGAWARLAQPFRPVSGAYRVVLAFNPDGLITAAPAGLVSTPSGLWDPEGNHMSVPFLALNPIVVGDTDVVMKEAYTLHHPVTTCVSNENDIRLELYYVASMPTEIRAVDAMGVYELPPLYTSWVSQTFFLNGAESGPYEFQDWSGTAFLDTFVRFTNTSDTEQVARYFSQCGGGYGSNNSCCTEVWVNITLNSITEVVF
jgi:hypothetical protein